MQGDYLISLRFAFTTERTNWVTPLLRIQTQILDPVQLPLKTG